MFNLFHRTDDLTVICALPDGGRLPRFLRSGRWSFHGKVEDIRSQQLEFDRASVDAVIDRQGFYLYTKI